MRKGFHKGEDMDENVSIESAGIAFGAHLQV